MELPQNTQITTQRNCQTPRKWKVVSKHHLAMQYSKKNYCNVHGVEHHMQSVNNGKHS